MHPPSGQQAERPLHTAPSFLTKAPGSMRCQQEAGKHSPKAPYEKLILRGPLQANALCSRLTQLSKLLSLCKPHAFALRKWRQKPSVAPRFFLRTGRSVYLAGLPAGAGAPIGRPRGALSRVRTSQGISARPLSFLRSHQLVRHLHLLPGEGRQACQQD